MAIKANLTIDQGSDFYTSVTLTDDDGVAIDISNYTGAGQIRKYYTSTSKVDFTVTTDENGRVGMELSSNTTNSMTAGRYVYDIELTDQSGTISRIIEGIVTVTPGVTR